MTDTTTPIEPAASIQNLIDATNAVCTRVFEQDQGVLGGITFHGLQMAVRRAQVALSTPGPIRPPEDCGVCGARRATYTREMLYCRACEIEVAGEVQLARSSTSFRAAAPAVRRSLDDLVNFYAKGWRIKTREQVLENGARALAALPSEHPVEVALRDALTVLTTLATGQNGDHFEGVVSRSGSTLLVGPTIRSLGRLLAVDPILSVETDEGARQTREEILNKLRYKDHEELREMVASLILQRDALETSLQEQAATYANQESRDGRISASTAGATARSPASALQPTVAGMADGTDLAGAHPEPAGGVDAEAADDVGQWSVAEHWSSSAPGTTVLMLAHGSDEMARHAGHRDFIRWVATSETSRPARALVALTTDQIRELCLANGFKTRPQENGTVDLNPYVFTCVRACIAAAFDQTGVSA